MGPSFFSKATLTSAALHLGIAGTMGGLTTLSVPQKPTNTPSEIVVHFIEPAAKAVEKTQPIIRQKSTRSRQRKCAKPSLMEHLDIHNISCVGAHMPQPPYPKRALRKRLEGLVRIAFRLNEHGQVSKAKIISSCSHDVLDQAALKAIKAWHFPQNIALKHPDLVAPIRFILSYSHSPLR